MRTLKEMGSHSSNPAVIAQIKDVIHSWKTSLSAKMPIIPLPITHPKKIEEPRMEYLREEPKMVRVSKQEKDHALRENQAWKLRVGAVSCVKSRYKLSRCSPR